MFATQKRAPELGVRLTAALAMAEPCQVTADIGADHGRLSAALLQSGLCEHALVADISDKALLKARALFGRLGLHEHATFAVADGLVALDVLEDRRAGECFILGMGGDTVAGILTRGQKRLQGATLILGAQTELPSLREALCKVGYRIRVEQAAQEDRRFYVLMKCTPAQDDEPCYSERALLLGPAFLRDFPASWQPLLAKQRGFLETGIHAMQCASLQKDVQRLKRFERELGYVKEALERYET